MLFEARELKAYAEPISSDGRREEEAYFAVQFVDEGMLIPIVEPLVFLGKDIDRRDRGLYFLQNFESYSAGIRYESAPEDQASAFHVYGARDLNHIFEYEHALESLMKCSLRRRQLKKPV
jgi:hypothetical protein